jgi:amino acid efflux transporter
MERQLRPSISVTQGVALYMGAVVGAGVLLLPGASASLAGPASLLAWLVDSLLGVPLALTFAALAARMPDAGGVSTYAARAFGPTLGTVTGWCYLTAAATAQSLVALTGAYYAAPHLGLDRAGVSALAALILVAATCTNAYGLQVSARLQLAFSAAVTLMLLTAIVVSVPRMDLDRWRPFAPHGLGSVGHAAVVIFFAFFGWEAICHLSAEFRDPRRDVPRSTVISVAAITFLFVGVAVATIGTGTYGDPETDRTSVARLLANPLGTGAGLTASVMALLIALGTANAFVAATSRLAYALARDNALPRQLASLNDDDVPRRAVIAVGGYATAVVGVAHALRWDAEQILVVPNSLVIVTYLVGMAAGARLLRGRRRAVAVAAGLLCLLLLPLVGALLVIPAAVIALALLYQRLSTRRSQPAEREDNEGRRRRGGKTNPDTR